MRYERTVNINELLEHSSLSSVMRKGLFLNALNQRLHRIFPAQYRGLYFAVDMSQDSLVLQVVNATVRQALLFHREQLLTLVQQDFPKVRKITFQINPALQNSLL